jgi:uncharacterized protein YndB with AHSA1/START domain
MLKKVAIVAGLLIVVVVVAVATRPDSFRVERSLEIAAPASAVFPLINDFHKWEGWSPWEKLDPGMKRSFEGAPAGTGAIYGWTGNDKVGAGRMTILDSQPDQSVTIKLEFIKPFPSTSDTRFTLTPSGSGTRLTWTMEGKNNFMAKAFTMFMDMDKMVGKDFEQGLASIKGLAEAPGAQHARN